MASFEFAGVTDTLTGSDEKYKSGLLAAGATMKEAVEMFNSPDFANREGWKKETENGDDRVFSKPYGNGKIFALSIRNDIISCGINADGTVVSPIGHALGFSYETQIDEIEYAELPINCEEFFADCWDNFGTVATWNTNFAFAKIVAQLTPNVDVVHYGNQDIMIIKGRDFVVTRMKRKIGNSNYLACRSFDLDSIPETKEKVRAILNFGGGRFIPHPTDPNRTMFDYVVGIDFKGMIPKTVVNQAMGRLVLAEAEVNRKHILDLVAHKKNGH